MSGSSSNQSEKESVPNHGGSHLQTQSDFIISIPEDHRSEEVPSPGGSILGAPSTFLIDNTTHNSMVDGNDTSGSFGSNVSSRTSVAGTAYFIASGLASLARSGLSALGQSGYYRPSWEEVYRNGDLWHMKIDGQCFKHHATFSRDYAPNMPAHWYIQGHVLAHKDNLMGWLTLWVENAKGLLELPRDYKKRSIVISGYIDEPSVIEYMKREVMDVRDVWPPNADIPILQQQNWVSTGDIDNAWANDSFSVEGLCGKGVILCMTSLDLKQQMRLVADEMVKKGKEMASAAKQDV